VRNQIREVGSDQLTAPQPVLTVLAGLLAIVKRSKNVFTRPGPIADATTAEMVLQLTLIAAACVDHALYRYSIP